MKSVPATVECVHSASKCGFTCTKEMMLLETSRRALSCSAQSDLIAGAPADLCCGRPATCSDLSGEHTPLGCWSGDCRWVPVQVLRLPMALSEDRLVLPGPRPPRSTLARVCSVVCTDVSGSAHCSPTSSFPRMVGCASLRCLTVLGIGAQATMPCRVWEPQAHGRAECVHVGVCVHTCI